MAPDVGLLIIGSYICGSLPSGFVVSKLFAGIDIRSKGTSQIGSANVTRQLGKSFGALSLSLDLLKALIPMAIIKYILMMPDWVVAVCGCATVFGHDFSVFLGLNGGEGLATSMAVLFFLAPFHFLVVGPFALATGYLTGYVTIAGVVQFWAFGVSAWATGVPMPAVYATIALVCLGLIKQIPWMSKYPIGKFMNQNFVAPSTETVASFVKEHLPRRSR
ncbi:MAG: glycerol-3-phosphate acyltransferase [Caldisericia bacterium]|nr:glycerol-3-phosphate acyltransferase [Caldisericia bacterium]